MITRFPLYSGVATVDDAASANSVIRRDAQGGASVNQLTTTSIANSGGTSLGVKVVTSTTTLDNTATLIVVDATAGAFPLNLPVASASTGQSYKVAKKDTSANAVTLTGNGTDAIVTSAGSANTLALTARGQHYVLWCDGTQWYAR